MKVTIYAHGTLAESHWRDAAAEYIKRLTRLWPTTVIEAAEVRLPQNPSEGEIERALAAEAKTALAKISPRAYVIALCIEGDMLTSPQLSKKNGGCGRTGRIGDRLSHRILLRASSYPEAAGRCTHLLLPYDLPSPAGPGDAPGADLSGCPDRPRGTLSQMMKGAQPPV